jgi:uncharacterized protein
MAEQAQTDGGVEARLAQPGGVTYMQIPAADVRASAAFYASVFGWDADVEGGRDEHLSFTDGAGLMVGAFTNTIAIAREPGILPYIYVDGVDKTIERALAAGGEAVRGPYPEGELWVATLRDPAGNVIGIWRHGSR